MRPRRAWFRLLCPFFGFVLLLLFSPHTAAPQVVAGIYQNSEHPGDERRLSSVARDAPLHLQKGFLDGVFGFARHSQKIPRQVPHARALQLIKSLVGAHVSGEAACRQRRIFGVQAARPILPHFEFGRFHSRLPLARYRRDSMLPRQRKSHRSHFFLLWYRRSRGRDCQGSRSTARLSPVVLNEWISRT